MTLNEEALKIIGKPESPNLEYKAVLPPPRILGQLISSFANSEGGFIVLGISESTGAPVAAGLSADFNAHGVTETALRLLSPAPSIQHEYVTYQDKPLYVIKVEKSSNAVLIEGKLFKRVGDSTKLQNPTKQQFSATGYDRVAKLAKKFEALRKGSTSSKIKFVEHYESVLKIIDDLKNILYPSSPSQATTIPEGQVLMRILFSSCADNFETYLSGLLYEIYLAKPETLKSNSTVTIKEVLDCANMSEFVTYWSNKLMAKLQRGSVKGFISDNKQLKDLNVLSEIQQNDIDKILQIRHLYSHKNGVVDDKFLQFFPGEFQINEQHQFSLDKMLDNIEYLATTVNEFDKSAVKKYLLATLD